MFSKDLNSCFSAKTSDRWHNTLCLHRQSLLLNRSQRIEAISRQWLVESQLFFSIIFTKKVLYHVDQEGTKWSLEFTDSHSFHYVSQETSKDPSHCKMLDFVGSNNLKSGFVDTMPMWRVKQWELQSVSCLVHWRPNRWCDWWYRLSWPDVRQLRTHSFKAILTTMQWACLISLKSEGLSVLCWSPEFA